MTDYMKLADILLDTIPEDSPWQGNIKGLTETLVANGVTVPNWIPVTKRLPDTSSMYIVTVEKLYGITYSDVAYFDAWTKKWGTNAHHYSCDKVTHWMQIPEPQKEI